MKRWVIFGALLVLPLLANASEPRVLQTDMSATGITGLAITAGVGEVHITPSSDNAVHVHVILEQKSNDFLWFFHWQSRATEQQIQAAQISQQREGKRLLLSLSNLGKMDKDDVKQKWIVQMPAHLALDLKMNVGEVTIEGVSGGVQTTLNVGELNMDVPQGRLDAKVNVGQISVTTATDQPGNISLSSNIGEAALYRGGKYITHAGKHHGLGRNIYLSGGGSDSMQLSVNIGEVDLRIEPAAKNASSTK